MGVTVKELQERQRYITFANATEDKYGLPKNLLVGVMGAESNFNPNATSQVGAKGLMQFMPATAKEYGINPLNPSQSIDAAGKYLASSYKQFGNWDDALRSYNMGVGGLKQVKAGKKSLPKETQDYTGRVYKHAGIDYSSETPSYANSIAPYINQKEEVIIPQISNFDVTPEITNFTAPTETEEEPTDSKQVVDSNLQILQQKQNEKDFLEELYNNTVKQEAPEQQEQQYVAPKTNFIETYNQVSEFVDNPIMQQGGSVKEDKEWLQNWYQNRVIPNEEIQNEYFLPQQQDYVNRAKNLKDPKIVNQVTAPNGMQVEGVTRANGDIELSKNATPHAQLHEMSHSINKFPFLMGDIHRNVVEQNIAPKEFVNNEDVKKYYNYYSDPEEIHARIQVLRKAAGIKPDQKVTPEFLQSYLKTYKGDNSNINDLLNVADEPHLIEMLNYMADNSKISDNIQIAQQGGNISQFLKKPIVPRDEKNIIQRNNTATSKPNTIYNQKELNNISAYAQKHNISIKDASERLYNQNQHTQNNQIRQYTPQTTKSKVWEVATHPMTAAGYVARNEQIPENFSRGELNPHDMAVDIINPFFYADQAGEFIKNTSEGNIIDAGMNALNVLPLAAEYQTIGRGLSKIGKLETSIAPELRQGLYNKAMSNLYLKNMVKIPDLPIHTTEQLKDYEFFNKMQDNKLLKENTNIDLLVNNKNLGDNVTKAVVKKYNTFFRGVGDEPLKQEFMDAFKKGYNPLNEADRVKYKGTNIPFEEYGARQTAWNDSSKDLLYAASDVSGTKGYGSDVVAFRPKNLDFSGTKSDWMNNNINPKVLSYNDMNNYNKLVPEYNIDGVFVGDSHSNVVKFGGNKGAEIGNPITTFKQGEAPPKWLKTYEKFSGYNERNIPKDWSEVMKKKYLESHKDDFSKINTKDLSNTKFQKGGQIPIAGASYLATQEQPKLQQGGNIVDNEKAFLEELKTLPISKYGMYEFPNQKVIVPSSDITMKNIPHKILGISLETGEKKMMLPEKEYKFANTKNVLEIPKK